MGRTTQRTQAETRSSRGVRQARLARACFAPLLRGDRRHQFNNREPHSSRRSLLRPLLEKQGIGIGDWCRSKRTLVNHRCSALQRANV
jgi:hypothetical protein